MEDWIKEFEIVRADNKVTNDKRLVFDHYREKVEGSCMLVRPEL